MKKKKSRDIPCSQYLSHDWAIECPSLKYLRRVIGLGAEHERESITSERRFVVKHVGERVPILETDLFFEVNKASR